MNNIIFSIIIPHKNIPGLLRRCLDSIPKRDDLEIIIVDDKSDPAKVDFEKFPGLNEPRTTVIFTKEGKGAGYARNVGLGHAKGKWVLFADADDFYNYCFSAFLNDHRNDDADVVYFKHNSMHSSNYINTDRRVDYLNNFIDLFIYNNNESYMRYTNHCPWNMLIKKQMIHHFEASWLSDIEKKHNKIRLAIQCRFGYGFVSKLIIFFVLSSRMFVWRTKQQGLPQAVLHYVKKCLTKREGPK